MTDEERDELLRRAVLSLERIANHFAPEKRKPGTAHLGTAVYGEDEKERAEARKRLQEKAAQRSARGITPPSRS